MIRQNDERVEEFEKEISELTKTRDHRKVMRDEIKCRKQQYVEREKSTDSDLNKYGEDLKSFSIGRSNVTPRRSKRGDRTRIEILCGARDNCSYRNDPSMQNVGYASRGIRGMTGWCSICKAVGHDMCLKRGDEDNKALCSVCLQQNPCSASEIG